MSTILREPEFKELCDALLRRELGPRLQTFAAPGKDGGIDALLDGDIGGTTGRWAFQYKFCHPATDPNAARRRIARSFQGSRRSSSEFAKPGVEGAVGYVLVTNVPCTVMLLKKLQSLAEQKGPAGLQHVLVWDPSRLNDLLLAHRPHWRSRQALQDEMVIREVIGPLVERGNRIEGFIRSRPLWPLATKTEEFASFAPSVNATVELQHHLRDLAVAAPLGVRVHPLYEYAEQVGFPVALGTVAAFNRSALGLPPLLIASIEPVAERLSAALAEVGLDLPHLTPRTLAYAVLAAAWNPRQSRFRGFDHGRLDFDDFRVLEGDRVPELGAILDAEIQSARTTGVPNEIGAARVRAMTDLRAMLDALWYPLNLEVDAPAPYQPGVEPA